MVVLPSKRLAYAISGLGRPARFATTKPCGFRTRNDKTGGGWASALNLDEQNLRIEEQRKLFPLTACLIDCTLSRELNQQIAGKPERCLCLFLSGEFDAAVDGFGAELLDQRKSGLSCVQVRLQFTAVALS
jgi:hypothetical protein